MDNKKFYASKTLWFNALTVLVVIATHFGYVPDPDFTEKAASVLLIVAPAVNFALRLVTEKPIARIGN